MRESQKSTQYKLRHTTRPTWLGMKQSSGLLLSVRWNELLLKDQLGAGAFGTRANTPRL